MKHSLLMSALMLLVSLSASAYQASFKSGNFFYYVTSQSAATVSLIYDPSLSNTDTHPHYTNLSGEITIPATVTNEGTTYTVSYIGMRAFYKNSTITKVNFPNTIKKIGEGAFYQCTALTKITIPNGVTEIANNVFQGCTKASELTLSSTVETIGTNVFKGCTSLHMVAIPEGVKTIKYGAFENCTNLSAVFFYGETLEELHNNVFNGCTSLNSINFPKSLYLVGSNVMKGTPWWNNQADGLVYIGSAAYKYKGEMPDGTDITLNAGTKGIATSCFEGCTGF